jgi:hypothetical protein
LALYFKNKLYALRPQSKAINISHIHPTHDTYIKNTIPANRNTPRSTNHIYPTKDIATNKYRIRYTENMLDRAITAKRVSVHGYQCGSNNPMPNASQRSGGRMGRRDVFGG